MPARPTLSVRLLAPVGPPTRAMRTIAFAAMSICFSAFPMPLLAQAPGQARTYVSGSGSDNNPCTLLQPCNTLQGALAKTAPGGQINTLDSANYGYVTIDKTVSIVG